MRTILLSGLVLASLLLCPVPGPCAARGDAAANGAQEQDAALKGYTAQLQGASSEDMQELITASLDTFTLQDSPPRTRNLLLRRMHDDIPTLQKVLSSRGYFKGKIATALEEGPDGQPVAVFTVTPGPRFSFGKLRIMPTGDSDPKAPLPSLEQAGLSAGQPYTAKAVLSAQSSILETLGNSGYPFPDIANRKVVADHATDTVNVEFHVKTGPTATFGPVSITGLEYVDAEYVHRKLPWKQGQIYDASLVEKARATLIQSGLFAMAAFDKLEMTPEGELPMQLEMTERKPRTFRAGVRNRTDTGPGGKVEWEHRTLFGEGEHFRASLDADMVKQELLASFRKPSFLMDKASLLVEERLVREHDDAYEGETLVSSVGMEYQLSKSLSAGMGVSYRFSRIRDADEEKDNELFGLFSVPAYLRWDNRNDILNPTTGWRFDVSGAPYLDTLGTASDFLQGQISYTHSVRLVGEDTLILAMRGLLGSTQGAQLDDVPRNVRFYAGGGNSVRGYAYRKAGDLNDNGDPIGGRSVFEAAAELRWRFLGDFGIVAFADVGRACNDQFPTFDDPFLGVGMGLRYYSFLGPIGVDVGIPTDRREGKDDRYQIYISLGQSF